MLDIQKIIQESVHVKSAMLAECSQDIQSAAQMMIDTAKRGNKIFWCGNGGSAADAQHMAAELMGGFGIMTDLPLHLLHSLLILLF